MEKISFDYWIKILKTTKFATWDEYKGFGKDINWIELNAASVFGHVNVDNKGNAHDCSICWMNFAYKVIVSPIGNWRKNELWIFGTFGTKHTRDHLLKAKQRTSVECQTWMKQQTKAREREGEKNKKNPTYSSTILQSTHFQHSQSHRPEATQLFVALSDSFNPTLKRFNFRNQFFLCSFFSMMLTCSLIFSLF